MSMVKIGIIGGSGLSDPKIINDPVKKEVETRYGSPASHITIGRIEDVEVVILARHGKNHMHSPSEVNYRGNILALKKEGCTHILSTTAVGSLREDIARGDFVILDQFIDFTKSRNSTFHDSFEGKIEHPAMPDPFDENLRKILFQTCKELGFKAHEKGTVITIEGPRFSTRAESKMFRSWGADVINMSIAPEAALANEAGIPYSSIAISTDYDALFDHIPPVSWEEILKVFEQNVEKVKQILIKSVLKIK